MRFAIVLAMTSIVIGGLLPACGSCGTPKNPAVMICEDSCLKVDPRDQASCLARCR